MKRLTSVLTAALLLAVIAAGCSSGSDEPEVPTPQYKVTKENIVGVWRSGDYWVSFSSDGYNSAYFPIENDERIDEGSYTISGDTITVESQLYYSWTKYIIRSISDTSVSLTIIYNFSGTTSVQNDDYDISKDITLTKSNDTPCIIDDGLDRKTYETTEIFNINGKKYNIKQENTFYKEYHFIKFENLYPEKDTEIFRNIPKTGGRYYIYLPPYLYTVKTPSDLGYKRNVPVEKGTLTTNTDGSINYHLIE